MHGHLLWLLVGELRGHDGHVRVVVGQADAHGHLVHGFLAVLLDLGPAVLKPVLCDVSIVEGMQCDGYRH